MTNTDPRKHPTLLPYLSRIQLAGKAPIGCKIVNIRAFAVTTYLEYEKAYWTDVLILENVWTGREFTIAASI
jgi:hypothetical protein